MEKPLRIYRKTLKKDRKVNYASRRECVRRTLLCNAQSHVSGAEWCAWRILTSVLREAHCLASGRFWEVSFKTRFHLFYFILWNKEINFIQQTLILIKYLWKHLLNKIINYYWIISWVFSKNWAQNTINYRKNWCHGSQLWPNIFNRFNYGLTCGGLNLMRYCLLLNHDDLSITCWVGKQIFFKKNSLIFQHL